MKYVDLKKKKNHNHRDEIAQLVDKKSAQPPTKRYVGIGVFLLLTIGTLFLYRDKVMALFNPVTIVSTFAKANLKETDGRTNILVLGSDKRSIGEERSVFLTDTILVASIGRVEKDVVMLSLPRDLWVKSPQGFFSKINAVYAYGEQDNAAGAEDLTQVIQDVLGIPVHYYAVVDFELFQETIDILGGIDVDVETAFIDTQYPVEGKEAAPLSERYQTVKFDAGTQTMDGETALKFVRSRKGNNDEGTDFARAARQQKVIMAIKNKALTLETILNPTKLKELYETYATNVDTNIGLDEIQNFYLLSQQVNFEKMDSVVLDDRSAADEGGLLYSPEDTSLYGGAYVLLPKDGNYAQLHAYIQRYIFGEDE